MGNFRMISKTVTQTQRFLQLPLETQALYFHLLQNTDDDGVVEAFPIVRMTGASEDSLKLLEVKKFVKPLNDEMVYFVVDFHEQNTIRADRKVNSTYIDLLKEVEPDLKLVEPKTRADMRKKPPESVDENTDRHWTVRGQQKISKDKVNKDKINKSKSVEVEDSKVNSAATEKSDFNIYQYYQERIGVLDGFQMEQLREFIEIDKMEIALVKRAIDKAADNSKRNFGYIKKILQNWAQNGILTVIQQDEEQRQYTESRNGQAFQDLGRDEELRF